MSNYVLSNYVEDISELFAFMRTTLTDFVITSQIAITTHVVKQKSRYRSFPVKTNVVAYIAF